MARPKGTVKYKTQQQRKAAKKASTAPKLNGMYFRLVIPNLQEFKNSPEALVKLKGDTLNAILYKQNPSDLQYYKIAVETHPTTGVPHLDILLTYKRSVQKSLNRFDYLIKHGDLTKYKQLNQAILQYGDKQDSSPLTNLPSDTSLILKAKQLQDDPYAILEVQMLKDPFYFNSHTWLRTNDLAKTISKTNWSKAISLIRAQQQAECNRRLQDKPGFQVISKDLIRTSLTDSQYRIYSKNRRFFDLICKKINEIVTYGTTRPHKTKNLLIVGPPDTGKTSLALQIQKHLSVYYMGVHNWFPSYKPNVYKMILWNQFSLKSMTYPQLLNFLEGTKMDLQYKGGSVLKTDNQLIYMTSNMTLEEHICSRFKSEDSRAKARANLRARIQQIVLPKGINLFLLQKLIHKVQ